MTPIIHCPAQNLFLTLCKIFKSVLNCSEMKIKADKKLFMSLAFIVALLIFVVIVFRLPVNAFIIVMPIFAGLIFLSIFLIKDNEDKK